MRQGKLIADHLKVTNKDLKIGWISQNGPVIEVYGVMDTDHQNAILRLIEDMKKLGLINRKVDVCFYELQTVVEWHVDKNGGSGYTLSPKKLNRESSL